MTLKQLLMQPQELLSLQPQELAWFALKHLMFHGGSMPRGNFASASTLQDCPAVQRNECAKALMEAWAFMESEGLIAAEPTNQYQTYFVSRRGMAFADRVQFDAFLKARLFPRESLHPGVADRTYSLFLRGEYETAIFQALKTVEVSVRDAGDFDAKAYGVDLMRKAFHPQTGPLTDTSEPESEREALMHLFAGAIGRFKNPTSHRHISVTDPAETIEVLHIASHLLRVVDDRRRTNGSRPNDTDQ